MSFTTKMRDRPDGHTDVALEQDGRVVATMTLSEWMALPAVQWAQKLVREELSEPLGPMA